MHELPCKYSKVVVRDIIGQQELDILDKKLTKERTDVRSGDFKGIHRDENKIKNTVEIIPNNADIRHSHNQNGDWVHPEFEADWITTSDEFKHTDFEAVIKYHDFTFVNFYAEWCIHCRRFAPTWIDAETKADAMTLKNKNGQEMVAKLLRINCVSFQDVCARIGIRAYPTIRMYKKDGTFAAYRGERKLDPLLDYFRKFIENESGININKEGRNNIVSDHKLIEEGCRIHGELKVRRVPGYFLLEA
eukprot:821897_1